MCRYCYPGSDVDDCNHNDTPPDGRGGGVAVADSGGRGTETGTGGGTGGGTGRGNGRCP